MEVNPQFWNDKKVVITGHTGFKGAWLSLILKELNSKIYGYSLSPIKQSIFDLCNIESIYDSSNYFDLNIEENYRKFENSLFEIEPDIVIHFAAQSLVIDSYKNPRNTIDTNLNLSFNLLNSVNKTDSIKNLLITTTDKVYKYSDRNNTENSELGGEDFYSASKASLELIVNAFIKSQKRDNLNIATTRSGNVLGGGDKNNNRLVPDILRSIENEKNIKLRNPDSVRPWQHVIDPLRGYLLLIQYLQSNNISGSWNFSPDSNNEKTVMEISKLLLSEFPNYSKDIIVESSPYKESDILRIDSEKALNDFSWKCKINTEEAINLISEWEKNKNNNIYEISKKQIEKYI